MNKLLNHSKLFLRRNSATILTFVGAAGVVATSVMAVKATPKALRMIEEAKAEKGENLTRLETIAVVTPTYAPSVITGIATIGCILAANTLNKRQQASLVSAYALIDQSFKDYKKKVNELFGEDAHTQVVGAIVKDKYGEREFDLEDGKRLYYDMYSERYFEATPYAVKRAEYELNRRNITDGSVYLNEWYSLLDLEPIEHGFDFGWSPGMNYERYWEEWISLSHSTVVMDDGLEVIIVEFITEPVFGFENYFD